MRAIVYVEGPSDKLALEALLEPLHQQLQARGVALSFKHPGSRGDNKKHLLTHTPLKAANILRNDPDAVVIIMPDLFPKDKAFPHSTPEELREGLHNAFHNALANKGITEQKTTRRRFKVFCFKHEMEVLLLAAEDALRHRLGRGRLHKSWKEPVEDQNLGEPPKLVIEKLFESCGKKYKGTIDAPLILRSVVYEDIVDKCPQCFKPFVEYLKSL